jgi:hypothetical protein
MSDYVIHSTAGMIGEVDSMLSRTRASLAGAAGAIARCLQRAFFRTPYGILDNIDPLAKLAAKNGKL